MPTSTKAEEIPVPIGIFIHIDCQAIPFRARRPRNYKVVEHHTIPLRSLREMPPLALTTPPGRYDQGIQKYYWHDNCLYSEVQTEPGEKRSPEERLHAYVTNTRELNGGWQHPPEGRHPTGLDENRVKTLRKKIKQIRDYLWVRSTGTLLQRSVEPCLMVDRNMWGKTLHPQVEKHVTHQSENIYRLDQWDDIKAGNPGKTMPQKPRELEILIPEALKRPKNPGGISLREAGDTAANIFAVLKSLLEFKYPTMGQSMCFTPPEESNGLFIPLMVQANQKDVRVWITPADDSKTEAKEIFRAIDPNPVPSWIRQVKPDIMKICEQVSPYEKAVLKQKEEQVKPTEGNPGGTQLKTPQDDPAEREKVEEILQEILQGQNPRQTTKPVPVDDDSGSELETDLG